MKEEEELEEIYNPDTDFSKKGKKKGRGGLVVTGGVWVNYNPPSKSKVACHREEFSDQSPVQFGMGTFESGAK